MATIVPQEGGEDGDRRAHARARGRARGGDGGRRRAGRAPPRARRGRRSSLEVDVARGSGASRTSRSRCAAARSSASPRSRARARTSSSPRSSGQRAPRRGRDPRARRAAPRAARRTTRSGTASCSCRPTACSRCCRSGRSRENIAAPRYNRRAAGARSTCATSGAACATAIDALQIDTRAQRQVRRLSGGNQQKVTIARWLATGLRRTALLRPDARHRRRHEAAGLRAAAPPRGRRRARSSSSRPSWPSSRSSATAC